MCLFAIAVAVVLFPVETHFGRAKITAADVCIVCIRFLFGFRVCVQCVLQSPNGLLIIIGALAKTKEIEEEGTGFLL